VDALPIPRGQPLRRAGLGFDKIRKRHGMHCGTIAEP
jgi:hypothetical protein